MANHRATGKKAKYAGEMVQRARAAVLNALDVLENRGKKISDLLADELEKNPIKFLELISKLEPRETKVEHSGTIHQTHRVTAVSETDSRIEAMFTSRAVGDSEKARPN